MLVMSKFLLYCSCTSCKKEVTVQSLSQHLAAHLPKGKCQQCECDLFDRKKFCSSSCSATYNNKQRISKKQETFSCTFCGKITLSNRSSRNKFCSSVCMGKNLTLLAEQRFDKGAIKETATIRKILSGRKGYKCEICEVSDYNNKPLTLQVDHVDGNVLNNMPSNLRLLCPNCHSQTPSWGGRNKGSGRQSRGLKR